jgi:capsid assembly protease
MNRALSYVTSQPWMIVPEYLDLIISVVSRERTPEEIAKGIASAAEKREERTTSPAALAIKQGEPLGNNNRVRVRDGVAVIEVVGPIVRHADFFSEWSGGVSTESLARNFGQALDAPGVNSILLFIDSPGGEAFGIGEFAAMIAERAVDKPVTAYIGGYGASAAYYIASSADEIIIDSSAMVGSIGTVMEATDYSKAYEARGIKKHTFVSQQSPKKRPKMGTESGDKELQQLVDDIAQVFVEDVARFRGVTVEKVLSDFGQGGMMIGKKAVDAGLADRISSFEAVLSEMASGKANRKKKAMYTAAATNNQKPESGNDGGNTMNLWDQLKNALSGEQAPAATAPQPPATVPNIPQAIAPPQAAQAPAQGESDEVRRLKAENAALRKDKITQAADTFVKSQVTAGRMLPAESESVKAAYAQAAADDEASPIAEGPSRVKLLEASFEKRPRGKHGIELVRATVPGSRVLDDNADPEEAELEKVRASATAFAQKMNGKKAS